MDEDVGAPQGDEAAAAQQTGSSAPAQAAKKWQQRPEPKERPLPWAVQHVILPPLHEVSELPQSVALSLSPIADCFSGAGVPARLQLVRACGAGRAAPGAVPEGAAAAGALRLLRHLLQLPAAPGRVHAPAAGARVSPVGLQR